MKCKGCSGYFYIGQTAWKYGAVNLEYYCDPCFNSTFFLSPAPVKGWIDSAPNGGITWVANPSFAPSAVAMAVPSPCAHLNFGQFSKSCPDCGAQIDQSTLCEWCSCTYGSHSSGIQGSCACGNCPHFIIPVSCIPARAATNTICYHPNLGNGLTCPDCKNKIQTTDPCFNCGCAWRDHTKMNSGPCKGNCAGCSGFVFVAKYMPSPAPAPATNTSATAAPQAMTTTMTYTYTSTAKVKEHFGFETAKTDTVDVKAQRKKDGVCVECGDRGTFISLQCMCGNGHGKIF